jgi:hypothetical protein
VPHGGQPVLLLLLGQHMAIVCFLMVELGYPLGHVALLLEQLREMRETWMRRGGGQANRCRARPGHGGGGRTAERMLNMVTGMCLWPLYGVARWRRMIAHIPQHQMDRLLVVGANLPHTQSALCRHSHPTPPQDAYRFFAENLL